MGNINDAKELYSEAKKDKHLLLALKIIIYGFILLAAINVVTYYIDKGHNKHAKMLWGMAESFPEDTLNNASNRKLKSDTVYLTKIVHDTTLLTKSISYPIKNFKSRQPHSYQKVDSGASALQNNAPNYGNQAGRDQYNINEKVLTEDEKIGILKEIKTIMTENKLDCIGFTISAGSNAGKYTIQLKDALTKAGYDLNKGYNSTSLAPSNGLSYSIDMGCLNLIIGSF